MKEKRVIDWEVIEQDYRAGMKTLRQIATDHKVTHGAINKRAKKESWVRNLREKIKARADDLVSKAQVSKSVSKLTERDIINSNAQVIRDVLLNEREDIKRLARISETFELELESYQEDLEKKARVMKLLTETRKTIIELRRRNYHINDNANGDADKPPLLDLFSVLSGHIIGIQP